MRAKSGWKTIQQLDFNISKWFEQFNNKISFFLTRPHKEKYCNVSFVSMHIFSLPLQHHELQSLIDEWLKWREIVKCECMSTRDLWDYSRIFTCIQSSVARHY